VSGHIINVKVEMILLRYDTPEMRDLITHSGWVYEYCNNIEDTKEMWSKIRDSWWVREYCLNVKDRPEVRKYFIK